MTEAKDLGWALELLDRAATLTLIAEFQAKKRQVEDILSRLADRLDEIDAAEAMDRIAAVVEKQGLDAAEAGATTRRIWETIKGVS